MQRQDKATNDEKIWIVIGDIHDETDNLARIPELGEADAIIVSGDLTQYGGIPQAKKVIDTIKKTGLQVYAQIGNMDKQEIDAWLTGQGYNLHCNVFELAPGIAIFGIGGSTITPFHTPSEFTEDAYSSWLAECWKKAALFPHQILVSHNPPRDTACDAISSGAHVGSTALREFIEKCQPDICVCGHIHEAKASDKIGKTLILNPGMLADGGYIVLREKNGILEGEVKSVK